MSKTKFKKMKKVNLLTLVFILVATASSFAQTSAGTLFLGGGLGFNTTNSKTTTKIGNVTATVDGPQRTEFSVIPGVGYFIADKLAVGIDISFAGSSFKETEANGDYEKVSRTDIGFTPYVRKYFMLSDNFGFTGTLGLGVGFGSSRIEEKDGNTTTTVDGPKSTILEFGLTPGLVFFPTNRVGLEANFGFIGFSSITDRSDLGGGNESKTTSSNFGFGANTIRPAFSLGFRYYLAK
jgi:hypothetical protein